MRKYNKRILKARTKATRASKYELNKNCNSPSSSSNVGPLAHHTRSKARQACTKSLSLSKVDKAGKPACSKSTPSKLSTKTSRANLKRGFGGLKLLARHLGSSSSESSVSANGPLLEPYAKVRKGRAVSTRVAIASRVRAPAFEKKKDVPISSEPLSITTIDLSIFNVNENMMTGNEKST